MGEAVAGVLYGIEKVVEGAAVAVKGIYDPTLPLKATLTPLTSIDIPRARHTVSVIKGRAYVFGGNTSNGQLADNDVHIVILPSSGIDSADYRKIDATSQSPAKRYGHCASVIEDRIYVYGGVGENGEVLNEGGRVWVFDTTSNKWSCFEPQANDEKPEARAYGASVATEHPKGTIKRPDEGTLPQQPPDPESVMPEIPDTDSYGTLIVQGGTSRSGTSLRDTWSFDISSRTWRQLPDLPPPSSSSPSLALVESRLYTFSAGQTSYIDLTKSAFDDRGGKGELGIAPMSPWQSIPPTSSAPQKSHPGERSGAAMVPVTTGQGRNYLLLIGGRSQSGETLEDIWALQLKPEGMTAASFKDAARLAISKDTREAEWGEVKYHNAEGVAIQEGQSDRGIGRREGLAAAKGVEVDGASVVIWGGVGADGKARGDGLMITVDR